MLSPEAMKLFRDHFAGKNGRCGASGVDTNEGTEVRWQALIRHGLVKPSKYTHGKSLVGPLGHRFSVEITDLGRAEFAPAATF